MSESFPQQHPDVATAAPGRAGAVGDGQPPRAGAPPLDAVVIERLRALDSAPSAGGEPALLRELAELLRAEVPRRLADLGAAIDERDAEACRFAAHRLRGSCSAVGATVLEAIAAELEERAGEASTAGLAALLRRAEAEFLVVCDALDGLLDGTDPAGSAAPRGAPRYGGDDD